MTITTSTITQFVAGDAGLVHYDRPVNKKNFTGTITTFGNVRSPLTGRQPLFSAINALFEKQRHYWLDFFKLPLYVSVPGSSEPVSLLQLDNPVSKVKAMGVSDGGATAVSPTIWGATRTTTITTIITAMPGDVVFLHIPIQTSPPALEYTTVSWVPDDTNSKIFPNGLPILVLTQVNGIVVDLLNQTLTTVSTVQAAPQPLSSDPDARKIKLVKLNSSWSRWSSAEKGGVIAASVLAGLLLIGAFTYLLILRRRSRNRGRDAEEGANRREKQRSRSRTGRSNPSLSSSARRGTGNATRSDSGAIMSLDDLQREVGAAIKNKGPGEAALGIASLKSTERSQQSTGPGPSMSGAAIGPSNIRR